MGRLDIATVLVGDCNLLRDEMIAGMIGTWVSLGLSVGKDEKVT